MLNDYKDRGKNSFARNRRAWHRVAVSKKEKGFVFQQSPSICELK